jgi:ubiquinone/menaquinone biosynthesis C-methylase UbiE
MPPESSHRAFFDHHAVSWDDEASDEKIEILRNIFNELNYLVEGNILDIGAGTGILVPIIKSKNSPDNYLVELDISQQMLKVSRNKWEQDRQKLVHLNSDAQILPFKNKSFDRIICFAVLPHLTDKMGALKECYRVMADNGKILILHLMSSELLNRFHKDVGGAVENDHLESAELLSDQLCGIGFQIIRSDEKEDLHLVLAEKP